MCPRLLPLNSYAAFLLLLVAVLLSWVPGALAEEDVYYQYQDNNGVWHLSDFPPRVKSHNPLTLPHIIEQQRAKGELGKVYIHNRGTVASPEFYFINKYPAPVEVEFTLRKHHNITTYPKIPVRIVVGPDQEQHALSLWPMKAGEKSTYRYRYRVVQGDPYARHSPRKPYRLPVPRERYFYISQGFHGRFSHNTDISRYAVDIAMPVGTPIHAARGGIIIDAAKGYIGGGKDRERYMKRANYVRILHDDGTMAVYGHLMPGFIVHPVGHRVVEGEVIARSGQTGYASGPHLHFVVQKNAGMKLVSIPFVFEGEKGSGVTPERGMRIKAAEKRMFAQDKGSKKTSSKELLGQGTIP